MVTANKKVAPLNDEDLNDDNTINVYVPTMSSSKRRKRSEVDASNSEVTKVATPSSKKRKVLPVRAKEEDEALLSNVRPVVEVPSRKITPKTEPADEGAQQSSRKVHHRFDSEDPVEDFFSTAREHAVKRDEEKEESEETDDEDSEDDAPEAIGMQEAAKTTKSREQDALKAIKE